MSDLFSSTVMYGVKTVINLGEEKVRVYDIMDGKHAFSKKAVDAGLDVFAFEIPKFPDEPKGDFLIFIGRQVAVVSNDTREVFSQFSLETANKVSIEINPKLKALGFTDEPTFYVVYDVSH